MSPEEFLKECEILESKHNVELCKRYQQMDDGKYLVFGPNVKFLDYPDWDNGVFGAESFNWTLDFYRNWIKYVAEKVGE